LRVPHIPYVRLTVTIDPPGEGEIYDGTTRIVAVASPIALDPGSHALTVKPAGHDDVALNVDITDGATLAKPISFAPPPLPPIVVAGAFTNSLGMGFLWIPGLPGGATGFGKSDSGGWVAMFKVTQEKFNTVEGSNPSKSSVGNDFPVESMTVDDANEFCDKLTARDQQARLIPAGWKYKLPTKDQWSYVANLAGIPTDKAKLADFAWTIGNSTNKTTYSVGGKSAAPRIPGLYDIVGDVWELTSTPTDAGDGYLVAGGSYKDPVGYILDDLKGDFEQSLPKDGHRMNTGFRVFIVPEK